MYLKTIGASNHELQVENGSGFNRTGFDLDQERQRQLERVGAGLPKIPATLDHSPKPVPVTANDLCRKDSRHLETGSYVLVCRQPAGWRHIWRRAHISSLRDNALQDVAILIAEVDNRVLARAPNATFPDSKLNVVKTGIRPNLIRPKHNGDLLTSAAALATDCTFPDRPFASAASAWCFSGSSMELDVAPGTSAPPVALGPKAPPPPPPAPGQLRHVRRFNLRRPFRLDIQELVPDLVHSRRIEDRRDPLQMVELNGRRRR